ncbi:MAG: FG-GAP-like repeat-containing protein, partial [Cyclobacteriaceae bacterium]
AFNQDLSAWDVSKVTNMVFAFDGASSFNQSLGAWDVGQVTDMSFMLNNTALSTANYDATLIGWQALPSLQTGVDLDANTLTYCAGESARSALIATNLWVISGDSKNCPAPDPFIVTNTNDSGTGSLRWVIDNANTMAGADVVTFNIQTTDPNYNSTDQTWIIQPTTPLPTITESIDIDASTQPGSTNRRIIVDGQNTISLFNINIPLNEDVDMRDLQVINGFSTSPGAALSITAVHNANNRVRLFNCAFNNSHSTNDGGAVALLTLVTLFMTDCDFTGNIADNGGGAIVGYGSGLLSAVRCNFINNQADGGNGGAIYNALTHSLAIERCSFVGNTSSANGGAITINDSSHSIENTTFSGNSAVLNGGAIYTDGAFGAISAYFLTVFQNTAGVGGGIYLEDGGIDFENCVLASNVGGQYGLNNGNILSSGHNFVSLDPSSIFTNSGDQSDISTPLDPQLGALANNGLTYYHPPTAGSPLIDAGVNIGFIAEDQTGLPRPQGPTEDIGAIEFASLPPLLITGVAPSQNVIQVPLNSSITFDFDNNVDGNAVNNSTIIVTGEQTGTIPGTFSGGGTSTILFNPNNDFKPGENIRATLTTGVQTAGGNILSNPFSFKFQATNQSGPETPNFFLDDPVNVLSTTIDGFQVHAADIDGDGDIDIAAVGSSDDKVIWFQNNGAGSFTEIPITSTGLQPRDIFATDFDLDGDVDLLVGFNDSDEIAWFENNGSQVFTQNTVGVASAVESVLPIDVDGDGDLDVVSANEGAGEVAWYENDGAMSFVPHSLTTSLSSPRGVYAADIDSDGDIDVLSADLFNDEVIWFENDGAQTFASHTIAGVPSGPWAVFAIDFDLDGDMDLMSGSEFADEIAWYENDGSQNFSIRSVANTLDGVRSFSVKDIDGDGDLDVATASDNDNKVAWLENDGSFLFTEHLITSNAIQARGIALADLDNDGDLDIISASEGDNKVAWYANSLMCPIPPTVDAGTDVSICPGDMITLNGTLGGSSVNATWTTSGTGTFDNDMILNATYSPSAVDETNGTITLTLTVPAAGFCPEVSDNFILTIPQPIIASNPTVASSVQQLSTIDVLAGSSTNSGDVLTLSILQDGTKGTGIVNADNTLGYTPNTGTVGGDSFTYRICNQCNLCSDGTVTIDIANEAPLFIAPSTNPTVVAGQSLTISVPDFVSDLNDNIDLTSFTNFSSSSNVGFTYDPVTGSLILDYANATINGPTDNISFTICDQLGLCVDVSLQIEVDGEITAYNGISPNGDGQNDYFKIQNIQFLEPVNTVTIYNRWGDKVFEMDNYNSDVQEKRFEGRQNDGKALPSGVYFYKVDFSSGREGLTGYLTLKK